MPSLSICWDPFDTVWHGCGQWVRRKTSKCKTCKKQDISCCDFHYAPRDFSVWLVTIHLGSDFWANRSKGNLGAVFQVALLSHFATPFFKYSRIRHHCYLLINSTVFKVKYFVIICAYVCDYSWKWQPVLEFTPSLLLTNLILNFKFLHKLFEHVKASKRSFFCLNNNKNPYNFNRASHHSVLGP